MQMILMLGACGALAIFSSTISKSPILPIFAKNLGASGAQIGLIASASTIPGIFISYLAGDLADRFGYKKILIASLLVFASAPFFYLAVTDPLGLGLARFYHGFATAAFGPVAMATIAAFSKKNTGQNLSLYSSFTLIGRALAPTVGGTAYDLGGSTTVYLIAAAGGILALLAVVWFFSWQRKTEKRDAAIVETDKPIEKNMPALHEGKQKTDKNSHEPKSLSETTAAANPVLSTMSPLPDDGKEADNPDEPKGHVPAKQSFFKKLWSLLSYKPLLFVGILDACAYFSYGAFEMVFPLYAKGHGMNASQIGVLLGVQLVGTILFKPIFGRASDKLGRLPMMIAGLIACTAALFLLGTIHAIAAIVSFMLLFGMGFALITSATSALAADVAKIGQLGASLGILSTLMDVGQTFGPPTIGALSDKYSYEVGFVVLGLIFLAAAVGCAVAIVNKKRVA